MLFARVSAGEHRRNPAAAWPRRHRVRPHARSRLRDRRMRRRGAAQAGAGDRHRPGGTRFRDPPRRRHPQLSHRLDDPRNLLRRAGYQPWRRYAKFSSPPHRLRLPPTASQVRHRLSRAGNRQINRALHIMAVVQLRNPTKAGPTMTQSRRRQNTQRSHAVPEAPAFRHRLPPDGPRRPGEGNGPGRTRGGGYWLQRGRLQPQHRHFGEVTSRTRHSRPYASTPIRSSGCSRRLRSRPDRSRQSALCLTTARTGAHWPGENNHPLDTEGSHDRSTQHTLPPAPRSPLALITICRRSRRQTA